MQDWNKTQPKTDGSKKCPGDKSTTNEKWTKAMVATTKVTTDLMKAMTKSHNAEMALMNGRIASITSGILPPAPAAKG